MNIFEQASVQRLRFPSIKGDLTTEDLWSMPLTAANGFSLDSIAQDVDARLKTASNKSFVVPNPNHASVKLELMLEILKHIISTKLAAAEAARTKAAKAEEREKLIGILANKQDEALKLLTPEEITKRIQELS